MTDMPEGPGERPRVEVRLLQINAKGKLEELSCYPLDYYGSCPNVGDTIIDNVMFELKVYAVQRRYFMQESLHFSGWALIVREVDAIGPPLDVWEEWQDATKFWGEVADREEKAFVRQFDAQTKAANQERSLLLNQPPAEISLNVREENVVKKLAKRGVGVRLPCRALSGFGPGTRETLLKRGLITVHAGSSGKFRDDEVCLTAEGSEVLKALKAYRKKADEARRFIPR